LGEEETMRTDSLIVQKRRSRRWPWFVGACVPFGVLMMLRETSPSLWLRAAIAGLAFVTFAFSYHGIKRGE
jgi:hypothetical protein